MRTPILLHRDHWGKEGRGKHKTQPLLSTLLCLEETNVYLRKKKIPPKCISPLFLLLDRDTRSYNSVPSSTSPLHPPTITSFHRDCHCHWCTPRNLVSQAAATAMRANAGRNPNHPRLRHTDPFDPTERRVCLAFLSVRKQGGAWAQGKCVTLPSVLS